MRPARYFSIIQLSNARIKGVKSYFTVKDFTPFLCVTGRIPDFLLYGLILVVTDPRCYNNV